MQEVRSIIKNQDLSAIIFEANLPMCFVSTEGEFLRVNTSLVKLLGYTEYELRKMKFSDITHPADINADMDLFKKVQMGEIDSYPMMKRYFNKHGDQVWARLIVTGIRDETDKNRKIVCFFSQIIPIQESPKEIQNNVLVPSTPSKESSIMSFIKGEWKWIVAFSITLIGGYIAWETNRRVSEYKTEQRFQEIEDNLEEFGDKVININDMITELLMETKRKNNE